MEFMWMISFPVAFVGMIFLISFLKKIEREKARKLEWGGGLKTFALRPMTYQEASQAVKDKRLIRMSYDDESRIVEPYVAEYKHLHVWCWLKKAPRSFRIDRIDSWEILDQFFKHDPAKRAAIEKDRSEFESRAPETLEKDKAFKETLDRGQTKIFSRIHAIEALQDRKTLKIKYLSSKNEVTEREVNITSTGELCFYAYDHLRKRGGRTFRYDRVVYWNQTDKIY